MPRPGLRLVVTGGIGSGKSTVARLLAERGFEVIDADRLGHQVLDPDGPAFAAVAERWPQVVVDGRIDRRALGRLVFAHPDQLRALEEITHPHIAAAIAQRAVAAGDLPLVLELSVPPSRFGLEGWTVVVVDAPDELRQQRAVARGLSAAEVRERMARQPSRQEWLAEGDVVIRNDSDFEALRRNLAVALSALP